MTTPQTQIAVTESAEGNGNKGQRKSLQASGNLSQEKRLSSKFLREIEKNQKSVEEESSYTSSGSITQSSIVTSPPTLVPAAKDSSGSPRSTSPIPVPSQSHTPSPLGTSMNNSGRSGSGSGSGFGGLSVSGNPFLRQDQQKVQALSQIEVMNSRSDQLLSPMEKVIRILKNLRSKAFANDVEDINFVLDTLSSTQRAYAPDLFVSHDNAPSGTVDSDVKDWIVTQFMNSAQRGSIAERVEKSSVGKRYQESKRFTMSIVEGNVALTLQLEIMDSWEFDVFKVHQLTEGHSLYTVGHWIFTRLGLLEKFKLPEKRLKAFLRTVEASYKPENLYHNAIHAADVTQSVFAILTWGGLSKYLTDLDIFAMVLGAIIHDLDHPGTNNAFQIRSRSEKATVYNDISVLENHHLASAFELLQHDEYNFLVNLPDESWAEFRESVIKSVLATDMAHHFDNVGRFKSKVVGSDSYNVVSREDRLLLMCTALKAADISSPTKPAPLAVQWTDRIMGEFFCQGDLEKQRGMGVSPFMDRTTTSIPKCQLGFIDYIVTPLWEVFVSVAPNLTDCLNNLKHNRQMWKDCVDKGITGMPDIRSLGEVNAGFPN